MSSDADPSLSHATIGIVTALPKEYAAVVAVLDDVREVTCKDLRNPRKYGVATVASSDGGDHAVVVALQPDMGTNSAAICTTQLLADGRSVAHVIMSGIAGAVPCPDNADEHVRLGDVVVSGRMGVVQYDFGKESEDQIEDRSPPRPPCPILLQAVRRLQAKALLGQRSWDDLIEKVVLGSPATWGRPSPATDVLQDGDTPVQHPPDPLREGFPGKPRIFQATIACANNLLKNPERRDRLREKFSAKAVEMEGSGVADAVLQCGQAGYILVRGTCDYCNATKDDTWQNYAALGAAAFTRALIEEMPSGKGSLSAVRVRPEEIEALSASALIREKAETLCEETKDCLANQEVERALQVADELESWLGEHRGQIGPGLTSRAYALLTKAHMAKAGQSTQEDQKQAHVRRARLLLEKAKDVIK